MFSAKFYFFFPCRFSYFQLSHLDATRYLTEFIKAKREKTLCFFLSLFYSGGTIQTHSWWNTFVTAKWEWINEFPSENERKHTKNNPTRKIDKLVSFPHFLFTIRREKYTTTERRATLCFSFLLCVCVRVWWSIATNGSLMVAQLIHLLTGYFSEIKLFICLSLMFSLRLLNFSCGVCVCSNKTAPWKWVHRRCSHTI